MTSVAPPSASSRSPAPSRSLRQRHRDRLPIFGLAIVLLVAFGPPLAVSIATGSWGIPHNDDWVFTRTALQLRGTGRFELETWGVMTQVGQILLSQPFLWVHDSIGTLDALGVASAVGIVLSCWLLARTVLDGRWAVLSVLPVAFCPVIVILSTTFMTDLPAMAFEALALALAGVSFSRGGGREGGYSHSFFVAAMASALVAISIRQVAALELAAVWLAGLWNSRRRPFDPVIWLSGAVAAAGAVALVLWRSAQGSLPHEGFRPLGLRHLPQAIVGSSSDLCLVALFTLPILVTLPWVRLLRRAGLVWTCAALVCSIVLAVLAWRRADAGKLFPGNLLTTRGPLGGSGVLLGVQPPLIAAPVWVDLQRLAAICGAAALLALATGARLALRDRGIRDEAASGRRQSSVVALLVIGAVCAFAGLAAEVATTSNFDRSVIPLLVTVPVLLCLVGQAAENTAGEVARKSRGRLWLLRSGLVAAAIALLVTVSTVEYASGDAFDAARWKAGELVAAKHPATNPDRFDAGYEWVGYHAPLPLRRHPRGFHYKWYDGEFGLSPCIVVSNDPDVRDTSVRGRKLVTWTDIFGTDHSLYVVQVRPCPRVALDQDDPKLRRLGGGT